MLRFRETSPELQNCRTTEVQQSQQGNRGLTPNVMDAKRCQIQDYGNVAGANTQSTAPRSASDVHGADTERNAGMMDQPEENLCNKTQQQTKKKGSTT